MGGCCANLRLTILRVCGMDDIEIENDKTLPPITTPICFMYPTNVKMSQSIYYSEEEKFMVGDDIEENYSGEWLTPSDHSDSEIYESLLILIKK